MISARSEEPRYRTCFSNGAQEAYADATADKGGGAAGFRPHELLEAALASCVNMTVRMYAQNHAIPIEAVTTNVRIDRGPEGAVFRTKIDIHGGALTPEQRERLLDAARACPVRRTLSGSIRFEDTAGGG